jgi:diguanylate cyclase (GGDEF)-like protein
MVKKEIGQVVSGRVRSVTIEPRRLKKDGTVIWCQVIDAFITYMNKPAIMGNVIDITDRKNAEQRLVTMATHDVLTGLPNRVLLYESFNIALANARRNRKGLAIMSLDLDKYKEVNDTYGHDIGDELLKAAAARLLGIVRQADTVSRIGGDEFVLILWEITEAADAIKVAKKIRDSFNRPFNIKDISINISASIGIAIYPEHGDSIEVLLKKSDEAMYQVKNSGRNNFKLYNDTIE